MPVWRWIKKQDRVTTALFFAVYILIFGLIIAAARRPLWYDEVWRPYLVHTNLHITLNDNQGLAPISLGYYAITKFATLFFNNNFTARIVTYLSLLALPACVYWFCKLYTNKRFAQMMLVVSILCPYILEYSTQDKPFINDIVCVLTIFIAFNYYFRKKLSVWWLALICAAWLLTSLAAYFALAAVALPLGIRCIKRKDFKSIKKLLPAGVVIIVVGSMHYLLILKSQSSTHLIDYYKGSYFTGGIWQRFGHTLRLTLDMFNIVNFHNLGAHEAYTVFWTYPQYKLFSHFPAVEIPTIFSYFYLVFFSIGLVALYRRYREVVYLIVSLFAVQWLAANFKAWPFGNTRVNLFSLYMLVIITGYGFFVFTMYCLKRHNLAGISFIVAMIIAFFPVQTLRNGLAHGLTFATYDEPNNYGMYSGGQDIAVAVSKLSKPNDVVLVDANLFQYPFRYYYDVSDYTRPYWKTRSKASYYGTNIKAALDQSYFAMLGPHTTVWYVNGSIAPENNAPIFKSLGYKQAQKIQTGQVFTIKYVR